MIKASDPEHANIYDIKGKRHLDISGKYYLADFGIRNMIFGYRADDDAHQMRFGGLNIAYNPNCMIYFNLLFHNYSFDEPAQPEAGNRLHLEQRKIQ